MNKYTYPIQAGVQRRTIDFIYWSESTIGAVEITDHTGYKIFFSISELHEILKKVLKEEAAQKAMMEKAQAPHTSKPDKTPSKISLK